MTEETLYMNERGTATIHTEVREILGLKDKNGIVNLREIQVVKVESEDINIDDLPQTTCHTISRIDKNGRIRIDEVVREVLGISDEKALLRIGEVEVELVYDDSETGIRSSIFGLDLGVIYASMMTSWTKTKDGLLRANQDIEYPPSLPTTIKIVGSGLLIAVVAVMLLSQNGALEALGNGNRIEWIGLINGLALGAFIFIHSLPNEEETVQSLLKNPPQ